MVKRSKVKVTDRFAHRRVGASGSCSSGRGNVLAVRSCCYVAVCSTARGSSAPTGEERGGGILCRHAHSLLALQMPVAHKSQIMSARQKHIFGLDFLCLVLLNELGFDFKINFRLRDSDFHSKSLFDDF